MSEYGIREACLDDVSEIAANVRQPDVDELWASVHMKPHEALLSAYMVSRDTSFTGTADGKPVCMFGVRKPGMLSDIATPWMIASKELEFHSRTFLRQSRDMVKVLSAEFPFMQNYVDARNTVSVRWLQWVGFSVYYPKPWGLDSLPFHRFEMRS